MAKYISDHFGKIVSITKSDGTEYEADNWHQKYIGMEGIVTVFESEKKEPGKKFIFFVDCIQWADIRTSPGSLLQDDKFLVLTTRSSTYTFDINLKQE